MRTFIALPLLLLTFFAAAQNRSNWDKPMELQRCSINIKADLFTATTFVEMEFYNPNDNVIEGLHRFQLNPGQAITAFQLDLFGKLRDGSIEEKWKAQNAYNTIVGKRIDPALLQMDGYNSYSLRIFPIDPKGTRRITMTIQQALLANSSHLNYHLPCLGKTKLKQFMLDVEVNHTATIATTNDGVLKPFSFALAHAAQTIHFSTQDFMWDKPIAFSIPLPKSDVVCTKEVNGKTHFALRHNWRLPKEAPFRPKHIAVYWDVSASGEKRNIEKELSFLRQYIAFYEVESLTVIPFNYKALPAVFFRLPANDLKWIRYLRSLEYEGATRFGNLDFNATPADVRFLVSDGYNSLGAATPKASAVPLFSVHASASADYETLRQLVGTTGGKIINLSKQTISDAMVLAGSIENSLLNVRSVSGRTIIDIEQHHKEKGESFLVGILEGNNDTLYFEYGNTNKAVSPIPVILSRQSSCAGLAIHRLSALMHFDEMLQKNNWQQLLFFGKDEGIVTYRTSYIVLERVEDYVKFNIKPPKELEEACEQMEPGFLVRNNREERVRKTKALSEFDRLSAVANAYNQRMRMWGSNDLVFLNPITDRQQDIVSEKMKQSGTPGAGTTIAATPTAPGGDANLSEVVVTGYVSQHRKEFSGATTSIRADNVFGSATSVEQALSGRIAGLVVTPSSPFQQDVNTIRIRGIASVTGNSAPLFVLDGMPLSTDVNGRFNINDFVHVRDIQWVTVLKDAQATALYGSRGVNGVIVIETKKWHRNYRPYPQGPYKLKDMEDMEYLQELKAVPKSEKLVKYRELKASHNKDAGFYLDVAQHLFESGLIAAAKEVLTNAAEVYPGDLSMQRAIAFYLEQWGVWKEAIELYHELLKASPNNIDLYRNLAQAYSRSGQNQKAVEVLYNGIMLEAENSQYWLPQAKGVLLNELNALVALHRDTLDLSSIPKELIRPLPVDLRIVIEGSNASVYGATIIEPDGTECREWEDVSGNKGFFTNGHTGIHEYQSKQAKKGRYKIRVNYYDYSHSQSSRQPGVIRLVIYKNFGKPNQSVQVENMVMDNQYGTVEIGEVQF